MTGQERIKALSALLAKDPGDIFSRYGLALEYTTIGETDRAIGELLDLLQRDPKYIAAYRQLGLIFYKRNETGEAKKYLRKGIELAGDANDLHAKQEMEEELEEIEDEW